MATRAPGERQQHAGAGRGFCPERGRSVAGPQLADSNDSGTGRTWPWGPRGESWEPPLPALRREVELGPPHGTQPAQSLHDAFHAGQRDPDAGSRPCTGARVHHPLVPPPRCLLALRPRPLTTPASTSAYVKWGNGRANPAGLGIAPITRPTARGPGRGGCRSPSRAPVPAAREFRGRLPRPKSCPRQIVAGE